MVKVGSKVLGTGSSDSESEKETAAYHAYTVHWMTVKTPLKRTPSLSAPGYAPVLPQSRLEL